MEVDEHKYTTRSGRKTTFVNYNFNLRNNFKTRIKKMPVFPDNSLKSREEETANRQEMENTPQNEQSNNDQIHEELTRLRAEIEAQRIELASARNRREEIDMLRQQLAQSQQTSSRSEENNMNPAQNRNEQEEPRKTLQDLKNLTKKLIKNKKLKELLQEFEESETDDIQEDQDFKILPLSTVEDLDQFNQTLKNDSNVKKRFIKMIQKIDGPNLTSCTNRTMERIMTDEIAVLYSYSGQSRGKNKAYTTLTFKNLKLFKVLRDTIVSTKITYTECEFIKVLSRWLNCAIKLELKEKKLRTKMLANYLTKVRQIKKN